MAVLYTNVNGTAVPSGGLAGRVTAGKHVYSHTGDVQGEIGFDASPTNNSENLVTSGSVHTALNNKVDTEDYNPDAKTSAMTQSVGKDSNGKLWTTPGGGSGGSVNSVNGQTGEVVLGSEDIAYNSSAQSHTSGSVAAQLASQSEQIVTLSDDRYYINPGVEAYEHSTKNRHIISEIFNAQTTTVTDGNGNTVDISQYDRVCAIDALRDNNGNKIILLGLGAAESPIQAVEPLYGQNCIIRSADGGKTWTGISITGKSNRKIYGFSHDESGHVICVNGDLKLSGSSAWPINQIYYSSDFGATWNILVPQSGSDLENTLANASPSYNTIYSKYRKKFYITYYSDNHYTFESVDGQTWTKLTSYLFPSSRNTYVFDVDGEERIHQYRAYTDETGRIINGFGGELLRNADQNMTNLALAWSYRDGIYVCAGKKNNSGSDATKNASSFRRKNGILRITCENHGLSTHDVINISVLPSGFTASMTHGLPVTVVDANTIETYCPGNDCSGGAFAFVSHPGNSFRAFISRDNGNTWYQSADFAANHGMTDDSAFCRDIQILDDGTMYYHNPGNENVASNKSAAIYKSDDFGMTWHPTWDLSVGGALNAIYKSVVDDDGIMWCGCQPCNVITIHPSMRQIDQRKVNVSDYLTDSKADTAKFDTIESMFGGSYNPKFVWEIGGFAVSTGKEYGAKNRIRTGYIFLSKGTVVSSSGCDYNLLYYGINRVFVSASGWKRSTSFTVTSTGYYRIMASKSNDNEIYHGETDIIANAISINVAPLVTDYVSTAPQSSSSTGSKGQMYIGSDYIYVCVDTNTWRRYTISTF